MQLPQLFSIDGTSVYVYNKLKPWATRALRVNIKRRKELLSTLMLIALFGVIMFGGTGLVMGENTLSFIFRMIAGALILCIGILVLLGLRLREPAELQGYVVTGQSRGVAVTEDDWCYHVVIKDGVVQYDEDETARFLYGSDNIDADMLIRKDSPGIEAVYERYDAKLGVIERARKVFGDNEHLDELAKQSWSAFYGEKRELHLSEFDRIKAEYEGELAGLTTGDEALLKQARSKYDVAMLEWGRHGKELSRERP